MALLRLRSDLAYTNPGVSQLPSSNVSSAAATGVRATLAARRTRQRYAQRILVQTSPQAIPQNLERRAVLRQILLTGLDVEPSGIRINGDQK